MRKRVNAYLNYIDKILTHELPVTASFDASGEYVEKAAKDEAPTRKDYEKLMEIHLAQISFFQHERLVHLMVTILFAILTFATFFLLYMQIGFSVLAVEVVCWLKGESWYPGIGGDGGGDVQEETRDIKP